MVARISPRAARSPATKAAVKPVCRSKRSKRTRASRLTRPRRISALASVEPSSTKMTSTVAPNRGRTASNSSQSTARLSASSCTGSTIEKDGRARTGASLTASGPARVRQIVVAPGVEHQQRPENLAVIPMAAHMLGDEPRDRGRLEQPARRETRGREALVEHRPEGTAQPARDGHAEALLAARDGRCRQQARGGALEDVLGRPPAQLQPC